MKNKDGVILRKILNYCMQIKEACDMFDNDYCNFVNSSVFQNACCMCILQIGELCKVISDEMKTEETAVPWKEWCGIRDIFAHQYSNMDIQSTWDTVQHDVPKLQSEIERILKKEKLSAK